MTQSFKGDALELQIQEAGTPPFEICSQALDAYFEGCFEAQDFLLALYDAGRMPFSDRVPRDSFVAFLKEALSRFPVTGTFESYIFILEAIFGAGSTILFDVTGPGELEIQVGASSSLSFDFQGREFSEGAFETFDMVTSDGETLEFRGLSGIDSEPKLKALLAELIPAGISPTIILDFFTLSAFVADDGAGNFDLVVDHLGTQVVFFETGE